MTDILLPSPLLVVDVEGNGQTPPDLIEVAVVEFNLQNSNPSIHESWLIKPPRPILPRVVRLHGITNKDVSSSLTWDDVKDEIRAVLKNSWVVAHNARVEYDALTRHLPGWAPQGMIDTLRLARAVWPKLPSHSLDSLILYSTVDLASARGTRHRALYDAYATAGILRALIHSSNCRSWEGLCRLACDPKLPGGINVIQEKLF